MRSWGETSSTLCFHAAGRTHSNRVSAPHSAHVPMAHLYCIIQRPRRGVPDGPLASRIRSLANSRQSAEASIPMAFLPSLSATTAVVPLPTKGSSTVPPRGHAARSLHADILLQNRWRCRLSNRIHVVVCVFAFHKVKEQLVRRSKLVLGHATNVRWLVPDHFISDFPPRFSHCECDSPRDAQPFLPFALVIEIEPVASRGPCNTVHLSPDGHEGFNVFLHGPFASDFMDSVADVPTSAVVRRARDGAIHGIIQHSPEYFSGVSKQKPALPAGEDG